MLDEEQFDELIKHNFSKGESPQKTEENLEKHFDNPLFWISIWVHVRTSLSIALVVKEWYVSDITYAVTPSTQGV